MLIEKRGCQKRESTASKKGNLQQGTKLAFARGWKPSRGGEGDRKGRRIIHLEKKLDAGEQTRKRGDLDQKKSTRWRQRKIGGVHKCPCGGEHEDIAKAKKQAVQL